MDPDRLGDVLRESEPRVRAYFRRRCRGPHEVDDLVQESMLAVLSSHERFAARSSIGTWMYAICRNVYRNHVYQALRDGALSRKLGGAEGAERLECEESDDVRSGIRSLIEALPRLQRELYRLYYVEGRPVLEIARILGRPAGTVKYLLYRLRRDVRALLA